MKRKFKKATSIILAAVILLCSAPISGLVGLELPDLGTSFAPKAEATETSGTCGENLNWTFDKSTGELLISGTGDMLDWTSSYTSPPWQYIKSSIKTVIISDGITSIGDHAFPVCSQLTSVKIGYDVKSIGAYAFYGCNKLTNITIPNFVTIIGDRAFTSCEKLANVTIGNGVTNIGNEAFYHCSDLTDITIGASVTSIGKNAFSDCDNLENVYYVSDVKGWCSIDFYSYDSNPLYSAENFYIDGELVNNLAIPDNVTSISNWAFCGCDSLTNLIISDNVTNIGEYVFNKCTNLTSVTIGRGLTNITRSMFKGCTNLTSVIISDSVTNINSFAFEDCTSLTNITIPNSVTNIGASVFEGCTNLKHVVIPDSVTELGQIVFSNCTSLTSVTLSNNITFLRSCAFEGCSSLTTINIPDGVSHIDPWVFKDCTSLASITIPKSVSYISDKAFENCSNLSDVYYSGTENEWKNISIGSYNDSLTNATIHYNYGVCEHTYTATITTPATCTTEGIMTYTCAECGDFYTESFSAIGHKAGNWETVLEPTTEAEGKKIKKCTVCGVTLEEETIAKLPKEPVNDSAVVSSPSTSTINYGDAIVLHVDESKIPKGGYVKWTADNGNFSYKADGATCTISPEKSGDTTFTATIYDANGNPVSTDEQTMISKAGFFQKIIAFFKGIFGLNKTYPNIFKF